MTPADQFYLAAITAMAAVVGVMVGIVCMVRLLIWLDDRRIRGPIDDDPQSEYAAAAEPYDWAAEPDDLALAALRRDLDGDAAVGRWLR